MSEASILARGRAAVARLMVDTCQIKRLASQYTDPSTGITTDTMTTLYTGACRVQQSTLGAVQTPHNVGEAVIRLLAMEIQLPSVGTEGLQAEDQVTILTSLHDADLVGRTFRIKGLAHKSQAISRRVQCQELTS